MSTAALLPLLILWALFQKKKPKPHPVVVHHPYPVPHPAVAPPPLVNVVHPAAVPVAPPAWPAVMPSGLPPFPGPGWVPDSPPPPAVVSRAFALLPQLWAKGRGATKTEQTAGRWITYLAEMIGTKKSVIAYRLAQPVPVSTVLPTASPAAPVVVMHQSAPAAVPVAHPAAPAPVFVSTAPPVAAPMPAPGGGHVLPTLRLTHPNTKGPSVVYLQQKLHINADGVFGSGTDAAVRAFQRSHGLVADGIVGAKTWAALG